jgi:hypothetical protein
MDLFFRVAVCGSRESSAFGLVAVLAGAVFNRARYRLSTPLRPREKYRS